MQALLERGISNRRGIMNAHQELAYAEVKSGSLPHSEAARDKVILLPLYNALHGGRSRIRNPLPGALSSRE